MNNPIYEIRRKLVEFEVKTGVKANMIVLGMVYYYALNSYMKNNSELVMFYPEIFTLPIRFTQKHENIEVGLIMA